MPVGFPVAAEWRSDPVVVAQHERQAPVLRSRLEDFVDDADSHRRLLEQLGELGDPSGAEIPLHRTSMSDQIRRRASLVLLRSVKHTEQLAFGRGHDDLGYAPPSHALEQRQQRFVRSYRGRPRFHDVADPARPVGCCVGRAVAAEGDAAFADDHEPGSTAKAVETGQNPETPRWALGTPGLRHRPLLAGTGSRQGGQTRLSASPALWAARIRRREAAVSTGLVW